MWNWIMSIFASPMRPLDPPAPLAGSCQSSLEDSDMEQVRTIQHDADNVIGGVRGRKQMEERARQRLLDKQSNPWGIGQHEQ